MDHSVGGIEALEPSECLEDSELLWMTPPEAL